MTVEGRTRDELSSVTKYQYGLANRLEKEEKKQGKVTETYHYRYDNNGNEIFRIWEKRASRPEYPGSVKLSGSWKRKDPTVLERRYYNGFGQPVRIIQDDQEIGYQYRGDGMRHSSSVRKLKENQSKVSLLYWDGMNIIAEQNGSSMKKYLRGINLIAGETDGVLYYYIINEHGDVVQLRRTDGTCKASYVYDAFGKEKSPDEEDENPFRYCGEYLDLSSETYYLRARNYRAGTGRFTSEDPIRDGLNWFTYCSNNPVLKSDPSGLYEVYDPHTRSYVDIADPMEASRNASTPYERLRILVESQGWNVGEGMSLEEVYYVNMLPYHDGVATCDVPYNDDEVNFWYPLAQHQTQYWQGVEGGRVLQASMATAVALSTSQAAPKRNKEFTYDPKKIGKQMSKRGWDDNLIQDALDNPTRTVQTKDTRWLPGADGPLDQPATAFYSSSGGYVVRNNVTGQITQISNRNDLNWIAPWEGGGY